MYSNFLYSALPACKPAFSRLFTSPTPLFVRKESCRNFFPVSFRCQKYEFFLSCGTILHKKFIKISILTYKFPACRARIVKMVIKGCVIFHLSSVFASNRPCIHKRLHRLFWPPFQSIRSPPSNHRCPLLDATCRKKSHTDCR